MKNKKKLIPDCCNCPYGDCIYSDCKKIQWTFISEYHSQVYSRKCDACSWDSAFTFCIKKSDSCIPSFYPVSCKWNSFQPVIAVLISTVGLAITITIPYWIGRYSGKQIVQKICQKYPKAGMLAKYQRTNTFFACFITRIVGFLPGDIVSIYFGACDTAYLIYLVAGVFGSLLSIITTTLLGEKISDPFSIEFMMVLLCRILVSVGAVVIKYQLNQKKK